MGTHIVRSNIPNIVYDSLIVLTHLSSLGLGGLAHEEPPRQAKSPNPPKHR